MDPPPVNRPKQIASSDREPSAGASGRLVTRLVNHPSVVGSFDEFAVLELRACAGRGAVLVRPPWPSKITTTLRAYRPFPIA